MIKTVFISLLFLPLSLSASLLNMIALESAASPDKQAFVNQLNKDWNFDLDTSQISVSEKSMVFQLEGERIGFMYMNIAIPWQELEGPCQYSPSWKTASSEMMKHKAHMIVSILTEKKSLLEREILLNKLVASALKVSESIGVYIGRAQLVRSKKEFITECRQIKMNAYPVANWVFFGLAETKKGNAGFSLGMKDFGYREIEVIESEKSLGDIYILFYNTAHYVIMNQIKFKNKETLGYTKTQKLLLRIKKSTVSKGEKVVLIDY